jgi:hypothetical protein
LQTWISTVLPLPLPLPLLKFVGWAKRRVPNETRESNVGYV